MEKPLWITGMGSVSAAGHTPADFWNRMKSGHTAIQLHHGIFQARIPQASEQILDILKSEKKLKRLDRSVLLAIAATRQLKNSLNKNSRIAVNLGSSRGATELFEHFHQTYQQGLPPHASPTTTLGNLASWVAQDLGATGLTMSHSITCSTALHSLLNGIGWLRAGFADTVIFGGTEAPLTPFTFAQMQALTIYSKPPKEHPCTPLMAEKAVNDMVLGEGASVFSLTTEKSPANPLASIKGVGFYQEPIRHATDINKKGLGLRHAMQQALDMAELKHVDALVLHAPGTLAGEQSELHAVDAVFEKRPFLVTNKNIIGHTFGASGGFGLQLAIEMLRHNEIVFPAYPLRFEQTVPTSINTVLVNAIGFGGNAMSVILGKP